MPEKHSLMPGGGSRSKSRKKRLRKAIRGARPVFRVKPKSTTEKAQDVADVLSATLTGAHFGGGLVPKKSPLRRVGEKIAEKIYPEKK